MGPGLFCLPLLAISLAFSISAIVLPYWPCGSLLGTCLPSVYHLIMAALFCVGCLILGLVLLVDILSFCSSSGACVRGRVCAFVKFTALVVGSGCLVAGNLFYATFYLKTWSFMLSMSGCLTAVYAILFYVTTLRFIKRK
ncbi:unnamed protein product [Schistocephalus solidus]|uniref:MARVEL domain-containing protein n=1 Tax=Schistocephalus solidus TaxID=70667 RepID=A0A183T5J0_SCHSO|nr:unnamed protein product [Schistocephalus solidus]